MATSFHPLLARIGEQFETPLQAEGDISLLDTPRRALLVSRTEKKIAPTAPWLLALRQCMDELLRTGEAYVGGLGRVPYELPLWMAARAEGAGIVVLTSEAERATIDPALLPRRHLIVWHTREVKGSAALALRDRLIGALSDRATAVHVRGGGIMDSIATEMRACGVLSDAAPKFKSSKSTKRRTEPQTTIASLPGWDYLTHFTREPDGVFPGEPRTDYFSWLCRGADAPPRDAFASLCRILSEKLLRASRRMMRNHEQIVCFTSLPPDRAVEMRQWRRGLHRWSFTPYGIAIKRDTLERLGAKPIHYFNKGERLEGIDPAFTQSCSERELDWSREQEWRQRGDVDLSRFNQKDMLVLTATATEAAEVAQRFGCAARAIFNSEDGSSDESADSIG